MEHKQHTAPVHAHRPEPFHLLSFEGPDAYSRAGGIASRVTGLMYALAEAGHPTSLWFVGDPKLPGVEYVTHPEQPQAAPIELHRWCQWISAYHPAGAYDGEHGKARDYAVSLPPQLLNVLRRDIATYGRAVVLAEEWHTAEAVILLDQLLRAENLRDRVSIFWNANNIFGFDQLDWARLAQASIILTVSRYMRMLMRPYGVDPVVIHNGLGADSFQQPSPVAVHATRQSCANRTLLTKVARWDPDKRWLLTVDTTAMLKSIGARPLLVARGGLEAHEGEVLGRARNLGLRIAERRLDGRDEFALARALAHTNDVDVVVLRSHIDAATRSILFQAADAVLANSGHEPFGLVGLEAMAVGGLVCTGTSGEDYVLPGQNALMLQQDDPSEFVRLFADLHNQPRAVTNMRIAGTQTAQQFAWPEIVSRQVLPQTRERSVRNWDTVTTAAPLHSAEHSAPSYAEAAAQWAATPAVDLDRESGVHPIAQPVAQPWSASTAPEASTGLAESSAQSSQIVPAPASYRESTSPGVFSVFSSQRKIVNRSPLPWLVATAASLKVVRRRAKPSTASA